MKKLRIMLILIVAIMLSGCIDLEYKIKVNNDGSGTITQISRLNKLGNILGKFIDTESITSEEHEKQICKNQAKKLGEGVEFVSFKRDKKFGETKVFSFTDIEKLNISEESINENNHEVNFNCKNDDIIKDNKNIVKFKFNRKGRKRYLEIDNSMLPMVAKEIEGELLGVGTDLAEAKEDINEELGNIKLNIGMFIMSALKGTKIEFSIEFDDIDDANIPYKHDTIKIVNFNFDEIFEKYSKSLEKDNVSPEEALGMMIDKAIKDGTIINKVENIKIEF